MAVFNYTIIIPHRNTPDLLVRCLVSIPVREDVQVVVVDDNSPDADTYLERYPELSRPCLEFIRTTEGKGAGYARNVGLDHAKGKWLVFADADDFFITEFKDILDEYVDYPEDILYFKKESVFSTDISRKSTRDEWLNQLIDGCLQTGDERYLRYTHCVPYCKFFKREFIEKNQIKFDEIRFSNDVIFSITAGCKASKIRCIDRTLYYCTEREGSLTSNFCEKPGEFETRMDVAFRTQKIINENGGYSGRAAFSGWLANAFLKDRHLYKKYFLALPQIHESRKRALLEAIAWQKRKRTKFSLLCYSAFVLINSLFRHR